MKIYLAIPYTGIKYKSFKAANKVAAGLMNQGHQVFSPISMCHTMSIEHDLPGEFEYWEDLDKSLIDWADSIVVVRMNGSGHDLIMESHGVLSEVYYGEKTSKEVFIIGEDESIMEPFQIPTDTPLTETLIKSRGFEFTEDINSDWKHFRHKRDFLLEFEWRENYGRYSLWKGSKISSSGNISTVRYFDEILKGHI